MHTIFKHILAIPRPAKRSIFISADTVLLIGALWLSFLLRLDNWFSGQVFPDSKLSLFSAAAGLKPLL